MNKNILLLVAFLLLSGWQLNAQTDKKVQKLFGEARSSFSARNYSQTIELCNRILKNDAGYVNAHLLLADLYNEQDSVKPEIQHLLKAEAISGDTLILFRLGEAFYKNGNYSEALCYYEKYSNYTRIPEKRQSLLASKIASCRFAINSIENPVEFNPINVGEGVNSPNDEYWPTPSLDGSRLFFTRLVKDPGKLPQEDFYIAENDSGSWSRATAIGEINTNENEGAQALSADAKILFFTACNRGDGYGSCDIYYSLFQNGRWSRPQNAGSGLNTISWEAQPSFSSDNRFLYFSSDRSGGKGKKDLWRIEFKGFSSDGKPQWGKPENMGGKINTFGDEISPFIHANNHNFYFASDGLVGMGRLDLFTAEIEPSGEVVNVKNMGYPINTNKDELGLTINSIGQTAYFSSARNAENGLDIFSFDLGRELRPTPVSYIKARVLDKATGQPVEADVDLVDLSAVNGKNRVETANENGEIMLCLPLLHNYSFTVSEPGYLFFSKSIQLKDAKTLGDPFVFDIYLDPIEIGAKMDLYNIYFEIDSFRILPESKPELEKLTLFLQNNPELKVEVQGHTDNTGTPERNQVLSEERAKSVVDYLVSRGIAVLRLHYKGFGENVPVANNDTEQGRTLNRRTTIKIAGK